jgi:hypothetical protein
MVYSHFIFMVLRVTVDMLEESATFAPTVSSGVTSYLLTFDVIIAIGIYIVPKLLESSRAPEAYAREAVSAVSTMSAFSGMPSHGLISGIAPSPANFSQMLVKKDRCSMDEDMSVEMSHQTSFVEEEDECDNRLGLKSNQKSSITTSIRNELDVSVPIEEEEEPQVKNHQTESAIDYDGGEKLKMGEAASLISGITPSPANSSQMALVMMDHFSVVEDISGEMSHNYSGEEDITMSIRNELDASAHIEEEEEPQVKNQRPESAIDYDGWAKPEMGESALGKQDARRTMREIEKEFLGYTVRK